MWMRLESVTTAVRLDIQGLNLRGLIKGGAARGRQRPQQRRALMDPTLTLTRGTRMRCAAPEAWRSAGAGPRCPPHHSAAGSAPTARSMRHLSVCFDSASKIERRQRSTSNEERVLYLVLTNAL